LPAETTLVVKVGKLSRRAPRECSEQRGCKEGMARVFAVS